jgi:RimJ/RimL family protein N-acetyltransferase
MDVHVRPLRHDEGALLDAVFAGLSPQSRYLRFHSPVRQLTASTRRALLDVDGRDHVALVAISPQGDAIGIARIIRDTSRSDGAEVAFEVADAWQGRGVGRGLLTAIVEEAGRIGVSRVHARVLTENTAALALLRSVVPICLPRPDGEATELVCALPGAPGWEITLDDVLADLAA